MSAGPGRNVIGPRGMTGAARGGGGGGGAGGLSSCQHFVVTIQALEGYANVLGRKMEKQVAAAEYRLSCCMFSASRRQFVGHVHETLPCQLVESLQSGAVVCPIEQMVFFQCHQPDPTLLLIFELTASFVPNGADVCACIGLGWAVMAVFDRQGSGSVAVGGGGGGGGGATVRLALYEGTPRALFSFPRPTSTDSKDLIPIPGCILTCLLRPHPILARASHLIPENTLVSFDDIIPGLLPTKVPEAFPKVAKTTSAYIGKVSLLLLPSVDSFEEHLLTLLEDDLFSENNSADSLSIDERRLKFTPYNGWKYTNSPSIGYLDKVTASGVNAAHAQTPTRSPAALSRYYNSPSLSSTSRNHLVLRGSLEVGGLLSHPLGELVLQLEYVVSWSTAGTAVPGAATIGSKTSITSSTTHSTTLTLGWGVWQPWGGGEGSPWLTEGGEQGVCVDLKAGAGFAVSVVPCSAYNTCYEGKSADVGKVTFKFLPFSSKAITGSQYFIGSGSCVQFEDLLPRQMPVPRDETDFEALKASTTSILKTSPVRQPDEARHPSPLKQNQKESRRGTPPPPPSPPPPVVEVRPSAAMPSSQSAIRSIQSISRATLAYLLSSGVQDLKDQMGDSFPIIDHTHLPLPIVAVGVPSPPSLSSSQQPQAFRDVFCRGPFQVAVQFMAVSFKQKAKLFQDVRVPKSLTLSFQFYQFPCINTVCYLSKKSKSKSFPFILRSGSSGEDGITHKYSINHLSLPGAGDRSRFPPYLSSAPLHVDVWDREASVFLGSASLPLGCLLQEQPDHFQTSFSAYIIFSMASYNPNMSTVMLSSESDAAHVTGKLYVRLARLPADNRDMPPQASSVQGQTKKSSKVRLARQLCGFQTPGVEGMQRNEDEQDRRRKYARMQFVREQRKGGSADPSADHNLVPGPAPLRWPPATTQYTDIIDVQREELERERIGAVLEECITSTYVIQPQLGRAVYLEHAFRNTRAHPLNVTLSWKCPELKLVIDDSECLYLRRVHSIHTVMDDNLITRGGGGGGGRRGEEFGFLVHPNESVMIPFKYQSFSSLCSTHLQCMEPDVTQLKKELIKVYLQASHKELLAVLNISVEPGRQAIDRVFHFYHPERTFLKKTFHLPPRQLTTYSKLEGAAPLVGEDGDEDLFVCSSDPNAMCEVREQNYLKCVFLKAAVNATPCTQCVFVFLFRDGYLASPMEVWQIFIHSAKRVDHSLVLGQSSPLKLTLRGYHSNRRVTCYSFTGSGAAMKVVSPPSFLLAPHSITELEVSLKSFSPEADCALLTAVDTDSKELLSVWLVCLSIQEPSVSRAFQITLPMGGNLPSHRTITFTNPYSKPQCFKLSTNQPHMLSFDNSTIQLQAEETQVLGLNFAPCAHHMALLDALVFINDDESDQTEECFMVKVAYA